MPKAASECWTTFKLLPNYCQALDTYRELQLASSDQTVHQRRHDFDSHFAKVCKMMDMAYKNKFEGAFYFVGNCINADTSLTSHYTTPGLKEFASRLGCADDNEVLSFAKMEA
ncbi:hypothetical protein C0991_012295 [Blastosporella zonata]|nr:hypothetical protein C0991_012295 [Blastosporella zonata]